MRVGLQARFDASMRIGRDAVMLAISLARLGVQVTPVAMAMKAPLPREFTRLFETEIVRPMDLMITFLSVPMDTTGMETIPGVKHVLYGDVEPMMNTIGEVRGFDGYVVTCPDARREMEPMVDAGLGVVPLGISPDDWPEVRRDGPITILRVGETEPTLGKMQRADVLVLDREDDSRLGPRMLATGGAVAAPNVWRNRTWLRDEIGWSLPGQMVPVNGMGGAARCEMSDGAVEQMLEQIRSQPGEVRRRQRVARQVVTSSLSWQKTASDLMMQCSRLTGVMP